MKGLTKSMATCLVLLFLLTGCSVINRSPAVNLGGITKIAVFPFENNTSTPQASQRVVSMTTHLLAQCNLQVAMYPVSCPMSDCQYSQQQQQKMRAWAKQQGIHYALNGAVNEWGYKVGLDGEPVASLSLSITDLESNRIIWSSVGSQAGGGRSSLGGTGLSLLNAMLKNVRW